MKNLFIVLVFFYCLISFEKVFSQNLYCVDRLFILPQHDYFKQIISTFNRARHSIDLVIYEFHDRAILNALENNHRKGIRIRVLIQKETYGQKGINHWVISALKKRNIPVHFASSRFFVTHQKAWIIDDRIAYISTGNFNVTSDTSVRNFIVRVINPKMVQEMENVFEADWQNRPIWLSHPRLVWSPINSQRTILNVIQKSQHTLQIYAPDIDSIAFVHALIRKAKQGVKITLITVPPDDINSCFVKMLYHAMKQYGIKIYYLSDLFPHAKMILSDEKTNRACAFLGSENFSYTSFKKNRELGIIIYNPKILSELNQQFFKDLSYALLWPSSFLSKFCVASGAMYLSHRERLA